MHLKIKRHSRPENEEELWCGAADNCRGAMRMIQRKKGQYTYSKLKFCERAMGSGTIIAPKSKIKQPDLP
jgi:hypothetical protein